jgi:exodeoxyribonuclease VII large subunit
VSAQPAPRSREQPVLTVGQLTAAIAELLGGAFPRVAVRGQISNLRRQSSGHVYLTLKDAEAQLPAVMWRSTAARLRFRPDDGMEVVATGKIDVYPPHGKYQLICDSLSPLGVGDLHVRFEQLKAQLAEEGLFDEARKRPLPMVPRHVAVVTSPTGAAVRDLLKIALRRMPRAWITVIPARVQGEGSIEDVVDALRAAPELDGVDVVIVARGGGSIEDLWTFNEEAVARAIAACPVPVVSAVGHETDTTIADFVADLRAATPSESAEIVFPDVAELLAQIDDGRTRLSRAVSHRMERARERLVALERTHALARPVERLRRLAQDLDEWEKRGIAALERHVARSRERVQRVAGHLEAVSPLAVLARGYSITMRDAPGPGGRRDALRGVGNVAAGDRIVTRLARGEIVSEVLETREEDRP